MEFEPRALGLQFWSGNAEAACWAEHSEAAAVHETVPGREVLQ
jgi:hypothetical protein